MSLTFTRQMYGVLYEIPVAGNPIEKHFINSYYSSRSWLGPYDGLYSSLSAWVTFRGGRARMVAAVPRPYGPCPSGPSLNPVPQNPAATAMLCAQDAKLQDARGCYDHPAWRQVFNPAYLIADNKLRWVFQPSADGTTTADDVVDFAASLSTPHTLVRAGKGLPRLVFDHKPHDGDFLMAKMRWS
jgi:hypothetical protein